MNTAAQSISVPGESKTRSNSAAVKAILIGGSLAGLFDIAYAMLRWSWHVPRVVAGGVLGPQALQSDSIAVWLLGLVLHFSIAIIAAAIYYAVSRKLAFLKQHAIVCGVFYGMAVYLTMNLVVVPLSALHRAGPFALPWLLEGLIQHMIMVGPPIALSIKRWGR